MKKILVLIVLACFFSCNIDNNEQEDFFLEIMPIESVDIAQEFILGQSHEITVNYTRPNNCYQFNDFIFQPNGLTRTVAVVDTVYDDPACSSSAINASVSFELSVMSLETYVFQFYQGEDENGEDQYLIIEVPVVQ